MWKSAVQRLRLSASTASTPAVLPIAPPRE